MAKPESKMDMVYATPDHIEEIKSDIRELEGMLSWDRTRGEHSAIQDVGAVHTMIRSKKKLLADHTPTKLKGKVANTAYKRAKDLEKIISDAMPRRNDYFMMRPSPNSRKDMTFQSTVAQQVIFQTNPVIKRAVAEWKKIMRSIDPDDPTLSNIERLRGK